MNFDFDSKSKEFQYYDQNILQQEDENDKQDHDDEEEEDQDQENQDDENDDEQIEINLEDDNKPTKNTNDNQNKITIRSSNQKENRKKIKKEQKSTDLDQDTTEPNSLVLSNRSENKNKIKNHSSTDIFNDTLLFNKENNNIDSDYKDNLIKKLTRDLENEKSEKEKLKSNCKKCYYEKIETLNMLKKCQNERDLIRTDLENLKEVRLRESRRAKAEIDALTREYCQIMSERDIVHKEIEALQEKLNKSQDKVKQLNQSTNSACCFVSSSNYIDNMNNSSDLNATRISFNLNQDQLNNKSNKNNNNNNSNNKSILNDNFTNSSALMEELQINTLKNQLKIVIKQRDEAYSQIDELIYRLSEFRPEYKLKEYNSFDRRITPTTTSPNANINLTNNNTNSTSQFGTHNNIMIEEEHILKKELNNVTKELDLAKKRRDLAFIERDKILKERESIRALCDELRHQRDKSISELAEALRESDDLRKQKSVAFKQIQMLEDKLCYYEEKLMAYKEREAEKAEQENEQDRQTDNTEEAEKEHQNNEQEEDEHEESESVSNLDLMKYKNDLNKSADQKSRSLSNSKLDLKDFNYYDEDKFRILKIDINLDENPELGVEFSYATYEFDNEQEQIEFRTKNKSNNLIIISHVDHNSIAYGKLKKNDTVLKINEFDLKDIELNDLEEIIKNLNGNVSFIVSRHFAKGLSNDLDSSNEDNDLEFSNLPSMSSLTSSYLSNSVDNNNDKNNKITKKKITNPNSVDYVSYLANKHNENILIELETLNNFIIETGLYVAGLKQSNKSNKKTNNASKCLSIGDKIVSINGQSMTNKSILEVKKFIGSIESSKKAIFKLVIQKYESLNDYSNFSSSIFSLDLQNQLRFKNSDSKSQQSLKYPESSIISSNSVTSSFFNENNNNINNFNNNNNNSKANNNNNKTSTKNTSNTPYPSYKHDIIRPLYFDNEKSDRKNSNTDMGYALRNQSNIRDSKSKLFDKIANGSIKYEDLVRNFHEHNRKEPHLNAKNQNKEQQHQQQQQQHEQHQQQHHIKKIFL